MQTCIALLSLLTGWTAALEPAARENTCGEYVVLSAKAGTPAPFNSVRIATGPKETVQGTECTWWQIDIRADDRAGDKPLLVLQLLSARTPFNDKKRADGLRRYILHIPETGETVEYRNRHTGAPLLPPWKDFDRYFLPLPADWTDFENGYPRTGQFLGHTLSLRRVASRPWQPLTEVKVLLLDPELLVGTGRNFKDKEGARLPHPEKQDYTYTPFTQPDYVNMLEAGINLFCTTSDQEPFVRDEPVFYLQRPEKKNKKRREPVFRFPADLYRSNFLGTRMFVDEPAIIMTFDQEVNQKIDRPSDALALVHNRIRAQSIGDELEHLLASEFNLGELPVVNNDVPAWETLYYTAFYQMESNLAGFVHEGRYRLDGFDEHMARWTGQRRQHSVDEMLRYCFAFLRGGTAPFKKNWGTAIYGQADPAITPQAVTLAYDMGARYVWFWTSDHDHHLPWNEQMMLARTLRDHAAAHPRPSIVANRAPTELAIAVPYGSLLSFDNLSWIHTLNDRSESDEAARHRRVMERAHRAIDEALAHGQDFDVTIDKGEKLGGYRRVVRISDSN